MRNAECGPPGLQLNQCIRVHTGIALIPDLNITLDHYQSNDLCPKLHLRNALVQVTQSQLAKQKNVRHFSTSYYHCQIIWSS